MLPGEQAPPLLGDQDLIQAGVLGLTYLVPLVVARVVMRVAHRLRPARPVSA